MSKSVVLDPHGAHGVGHHLLAEALVLEQPGFDALAQRVQRDGRGEQPDADDHHQVDVVVHAQPRGIDPRHAAAAGAVIGGSPRGGCSGGGMAGRVALHDAG
jgi:hypothetical protein